jgi:hypothetical protein
MVYYDFSVVVAFEHEPLACNFSLFFFRHGGQGVAVVQILAYFSFWQLKQSDAFNLCRHPIHSTVLQSK